MTTSHAVERESRSLEHQERRKVRAASPASKSGDRMLACRYELKYLITEAKAAAVHEYIRTAAREAFDRGHSRVPDDSRHGA